jgi:enoyl-CoA hydratase/carnithine racemase
MSAVLREIDGPVGRITLNRPERMNAISVELARELGEALSTFGNRRDINVIVIRGAGQNFCAGGDFDEVQRLRDQGAPALRSLFTTFKDACDAIRGIPVPVVAAVEGVAMAGGFELMQAADIVLVSEEARISDNHVRFGMVPGGGSTARLPRIVGRQQALGLLLSGDRLTGAQAVVRGLAYRSLPQHSFTPSVEEFLVTLAGRDRAAVRTIKQLVNDSPGRTLRQAQDAETDAVVAHICGQAGHDSVSAFHNREAQI